MPKATATIRDAIDAFLSSKRCAIPNTRRAYGDALDKVAGVLDPARPAADLTSDDLAAAVHDIWGESAPATWNQRRAAVASWVAWCAKNGYPLPELPAALERQPEPLNETRRAGTGRRRARAGPQGCAASGEDPVAHALRDRRSRQRDPRARYRGP